MGVKLSIEIISPLDEEDRDLLSGVAVMTLAIANHEMAKARFPEAFLDEDEEDGRMPLADRDEPGPSADPVPAGTARATRGDTTPADDLPCRGGKGEVWPPDPRQPTGRRP